mmetsp:Transcript_8097/g.17595  ORF Transcript_8097/g.17595 Transcript_8097/m.17595 type:complete len:616 (-) Transcript_8097:461-2308(-)
MKNVMMLLLGLVPGIFGATDCWLFSGEATNINPSNWFNSGGDIMFHLTFKKADEGKLIMNSAENSDWGVEVVESLPFVGEIHVHVSHIETPDPGFEVHITEKAGINKKIYFFPDRMAYALESVDGAASGKGTECQPIKTCWSFDGNINDITPSNWINEDEDILFHLTFKKSNKGKLIMNSQKDGVWGAEVVKPLPFSGDVNVYISRTETPKRGFDVQITEQIGTKESIYFFSDRITYTLEKVNGAASGKDVECRPTRPTIEPRTLAPSSIPTKAFEQNCLIKPPRAFHWDVEPHSLKTRWETDRENLSREWLTMLDRTNSECLFESSLKLAADLSMHYDLIVDGKPYVEVTIDGVTKMLANWVIPKLDIAVVMSYRDRAFGVEGIVTKIKDEVALAKETIGTKVVAAVELDDVGSNKTDFSAEGSVYAEKVLDQVDGHYEDQSSFAGTAIHFYRAYDALVEAGGDEASKPRLPVSPELDRGLFVWDYTIALDDDLSAELLQFIRMRGITALYFEAWLLQSDPQYHLRFVKFINLMTAHGISIDLLHGGHQWAEEMNHDEAIGVCQGAIAFVNKFTCPSSSSPSSMPSPLCIDEVDYIFKGNKGCKKYGKSEKKMQ